MKVSECADEFDFNLVVNQDWDKTDPQRIMVKRQIDFQALVGGYDPRLKDFGEKTYCLPQQAIHHLDMAVQECGEAWDMVEGGWKHHKTNPKPGDRLELLMELVDVYHFVVNAYIFMGGQPEAELVAAAVGRGAGQLRVPRTGLDYFWGVGKRLYDQGGAQIDMLYGHGKGSHGEPWEAAVATRINFLRQQLSDVSGALRHQIIMMDGMVNGFKFPPGSGYVYQQTVPALLAAVAMIPEVGIDHFYAAFMHKNEINFNRQRDNY